MPASVPSRPPQNTYTSAPSSAPRSIDVIALPIAARRTPRSLEVKAPSLKAGWPKRFVVAIPTPSPVSSSAASKRATMRSALGGRAPVGDQIVVVQAHAPCSELGQAPHRVDRVHRRARRGPEGVGAGVADGPEPEREAVLGPRCECVLVRHVSDTSPSRGLRCSMSAASRRRPRPRGSRPRASRRAGATGVSSRIAASRWCSSCTKVCSQPIMWPCGHQCSQNGWSGSETRTVRKPCARAPGVEPVRWTSSSLSRSRSKRERALGAVDLPREGVLAPGREARRLDRADRAALEGRPRTRPRRRPRAPGGTCACGPRPTRSRRRGSGQGRPRARRGRRARPSPRRRVEPPDARRRSRPTPAGSGRGSAGCSPSSPASIISRASRTAGTNR